MFEKTVLVVDDNKDSLKLVKDVLEAYGYRVLEATHGLEAVELVRSEKPDLVLIQLPEVDGLTATMMIKEGESCCTPVVAISAFAMEQDRERAMQAGLDGYLTKPINTRDLPRIVASFMK